MFFVSIFYHLSGTFVKLLHFYCIKNGPAFLRGHQKFIYEITLDRKVQLQVQLEDQLLTKESALMSNQLRM